MTSPSISGTAPPAAAVSPPAAPTQASARTRCSPQEDRVRVGLIQVTAASIFAALGGLTFISSVGLAEITVALAATCGYLPIAAMTAAFALVFGVLALAITARSFSLYSAAHNNLVKA